jgi:hypothetical protein
VNQDLTSAHPKKGAIVAVEKVMYQRYLDIKLTLALAASSTPIVVLFLCSTPSDPTIASAKASSPHIVKHFSALERYEPI